MITLKDVAKAAGVSVATVSYVLRGTKSVTPDVEQRVLAAAQRLGYRPNRHAQALRTGRSHTLGLVIPDLTNPYFPALAQAIETTCRRLGYSLVLLDSHNNPEEEAEALTLLEKQKVDGILCIPANTLTKQVVSVPMIVIDRPAPGFDNIHADHHQGGKLWAQFALNHDYHRIGLISASPQLPSAEQRRNSFLELASGKLEIVWEIVLPLPLSLTASTKRIIGDEVDLIVAVNDVIAIEAMRVLCQRGKAIPKDVAIIGFDDIPWATLNRPTLSTVRQAIGDIGQQAVELLLWRLENPLAQLSNRILPVELIKRESA